MAMKRIKYIGIYLPKESVWSTGEENDKPLQYSCLENTINSIKGKMTAC